MITVRYRRDWWSFRCRGAVLPQQGWWNFSRMEVALRNTRTQKKVTGSLWGWWNLPHVMEVASSSIKSQQYNRRALLRTPIPCHHMDRYHKTTHQNNSNLTPDEEKQAGSKWSWNLRPRPPNYDLAVAFTNVELKFEATSTELAVAFIGNDTEIWGHVRQITSWQWHHREIGN